MKIAVVTASIVTNKLLQPVPFDGVDYHAFTDHSESNGWQLHDIVPF